MLLVSEKKPSPEATVENEALSCSLQAARSLGQPTAPQSGATHVLHQN